MAIIILVLVGYVAYKQVEITTLYLVISIKTGGDHYSGFGRIRSIQTGGNRHSAFGTEVTPNTY